MQIVGTDPIQQTAGDKSSGGLVSVGTGRLAASHATCYSVSDHRDRAPASRAVDPTHVRYNKII